MAGGGTSRRLPRAAGERGRGGLPALAARLVLLAAATICTAALAVALIWAFAVSQP